MFMLRNVVEGKGKAEEDPATWKACHQSIRAFKWRKMLAYRDERPIPRAKLIP